MRMRLGLFLVELFLFAFAADAYANSIVAAPPKPPHIQNEKKKGPPSQNVALMYFNLRAFKDQQEQLKSESLRDTNDDQVFWEELRKFGDPLVQSDLLAPRDVKVRGTQAWNSGDKFVDLKISYVIDRDGVPILILGFPIELSQYSNKYQVSMVGEEAHQVFRRLLSQFKAYFKVGYNPTFYGAVSFNEKLAPYQFRFHSTFEGLQVELNVPDKNPLSSAFLEKMKGILPWCRETLKVRN